HRARRGFRSRTGEALRAADRWIGSRRSTGGPAQRNSAWSKGPARVYATGLGERPLASLLASFEKSEPGTSPPRARVEKGLAASLSSRAAGAGSPTRR